MKLDDAKTAEVSEFEKKEVKKILDGIVGEAMGEKKPVLGGEALAGEASVEKALVKKASIEKTVTAKKAPVKKTTGKRMDFAKKAPTKSSVVKKPVAKPAKKVVLKETPKREVLQKEEASKKEMSQREILQKEEAPKKEMSQKEISQKEEASKKEVVLQEVGTLRKKEVPKRSPLVSIIVPVRNAARYIDNTIHSVLGQTFSDFELIIVDDCSEDGTLRVVREFSSDKILTVALTQKGGMANARNAGVEKASGRYICFLNARDMWQPEKLERQIEFMQDNGAAFSYTGYVYSDENGTPSGKAVRVPAEISGLQASRVSSILVSTVMLDLSKLTKDDIMMPVSVRNPKTATWQKILKKTSRAYGLNEVLVIRGYDYKAPLWKRVWRRV